MKPVFSPRPTQSRILRYSSGKLGISAVPGSGKTHTLSALAAQLIASNRLEPGQEVLIVTLVNSAVNNFASRISGNVRAKGLLPHPGYRVRTLHGLANDIVREDPPLVGLDRQFTIVDESASLEMIRNAVHAWIHLHQQFQDIYLSDSLKDFQKRKVLHHGWPELIESLAVSFIRSAKDQRMAPELLRRLSGCQPIRLPLFEMGLEIYTDYQRALAYRGAVDFDDLVRLAADLLDSSPELLERFRYRWPFILEDEAQDSSELQQRIISTLAGDFGNWVRVGDPNQAIFETFTTANPDLLRDFIRRYSSEEMPESGRCQPSVMKLANQLVTWTMTQHPVHEIRDALGPPLIQPAPMGDPQPNPPEDPAGVKLIATKFTPEREVNEVASSIEQWLPAHQDWSVAVLCATNEHAANLVKVLQERKIPFLEFLRSTSPTRAAADALHCILSYLSTPESSSKLALAYRIWRRNWKDNHGHDQVMADVASVLTRLKRVENYLAPASLDSYFNDQVVKLDLEADWPFIMSDPQKDQVYAELKAFQQVMHRWHGATALPIDQLLLIMSQDIFNSAADLAVAHKLAIVMRQISDENPTWRVPEIAPSLQEIANNERRFIGFSDDDSGFDPDEHKGVVLVSTLHKAKGLEWDRVYLMSVNSYDFPSALLDDRFISEKWFIRDALNLEAEALAQLRCVLSPDKQIYEEPALPTRQARLDYARERLRLLYVGITRARRELIMTWNSGRKNTIGPAIPLTALQDWWNSTQKFAFSA